MQIKYMGFNVGGYTTNLKESKNKYMGWYEAGK